MMSLLLHIFFHFLISLIAGSIVWKLFNHPLLSAISAIIGGVFVDFDHFIDYFLAFGINFKLDYFVNGYEFLKTDKLYLFFHGWEYVVILLVIALLLNKKNIKTFRTLRTVRIIFIGLALGLFFHLATDVYLNEMPVKSYFVSYRAYESFSSDKLLTSDLWKEHKYLKSEAGF